MNKNLVKSVTILAGLGTLGCNPPGKKETGKPIVFL
jgi:hypothetical protein